MADTPDPDAPTAPDTAPPGSRRTPVKSELRAVAYDRYERGREIARGGMGRILSARDVRHQRPVAIKELIAGDERRFEREALITAALQHPAIVPVYEAGRWPDGSPFYAMKLVDGGPLDHAIARCATLGARIALLPNVIAVADALAYAHRHRIIHRDLKPSNVLVGKYGETYVIDWGLAKRVDEPDTDAPTLRPSRVDVLSAADALTAIGDVVGTPIYMPPEQAAGAAVDERADVYALGAMLYHVLAGTPPYETASLEVMLARLVDGAPVPLARRVPGAPADLVTIVDTAMARDPAARYRNAGELADELRRFQTGKLVLSHDYSLATRVARFVRKNRLAVAFAMLIVAAVAVFAIQRDRTEKTIEAERHSAEAERQSADTLAAALRDLTPKLRRLGRLDVLGDMARKLSAPYQNAAPQNAHDHGIYGLALAVRGYVERLHHVGHSLPAIETFKRAADELEHADGDDAAATLVEVWTELVKVAVSPADQLDYATRAATLAEQLARRDTADPIRAKQALAMALVRRADVEATQGMFDRGRADIDGATALAAHAAPVDVEQVALHEELIVAIADADGWLAYSAGHNGAALAAYEHAGGLARDALATAPDAIILDQLTEVCMWSCLVSHDLGDDDTAHARCTEAIARGTTLVDIDRTNVGSLSMLVEAYVSAGLVGIDPDGSFDRALAISAPLDAEFRADIHRDKGKVATTAHRWADARADFDAALALARDAAAIKPDDTDLARRIEWNLVSGADVRLELGDLDGAAAQLAEAATRTATLAKQNPDDRLIQTDLADAEDGLARIELARGNARGAEKLLADPIAIHRRIAAIDPADDDNTLALAAALDHLADALADRAAAVAACKESVALTAPRAHSPELATVLAERRAHLAKLLH